MNKIKSQHQRKLKVVRQFVPIHILIQGPQPRRPACAALRPRRQRARAAVTDQRPGVGVQHGRLSRLESLVCVGATVNMGALIPVLKPEESKQGVAGRIQRYGRPAGGVPRGPRRRDAPFRGLSECVDLELEAEAATSYRADSDELLLESRDRL